MPVAVSDFAHVRLTVTDIDRSREFCDAVFGFDVAFEAPPADADQETKDQLAFLFGGVIYSFGGGLLGLRPVASGGDRHNEDKVGLDHLSLAMPGRADLESAVTLLDGLGVTHGGIKDIGAGFILEFRDPDNVALELFASA
ncbi:VOC family protein [Arthrobacter sp. H5]|uniref:VOC family protein n=1 Tax=Arthrobacter sp. H5 TaxID=1267973 RepID=UPI000483F75E|nr:VOC family protein [Arthrobacter sp. H5]